MIVPRGAVEIIGADGEDTFVPQTELGQLGILRAVRRPFVELKPVGNTEGDPAQNETEDQQGEAHGEENMG